MHNSENNPLVSIIMPTFNRGHILHVAINSILRQSHGNFELIIVDDSSKDNTREVVEGFSKQDVRVIYRLLDKNSGASAARNAGLNIAKGSYITFIDSDDEYHADKIEKQLNLFFNSKDPNLGIVTCGRQDFRGGKPYITWVPSINTDVLNSLFRDKRMGAGTPFLMIRKDVLASGVRFDSNINVVEDFDLVVQTLMKGFSFDFVAEPLVNVYHDETDRNFNYDRGFRAREYLYKKYYSYLKDHHEEQKAFLMKTCLFYVESKDSVKESVIFSEVKEKWPVVWYSFQVIRKMPKGKLRNAAIKFIKSNVL